MSVERDLGFAALNVSFHIMVTLARRGLLSPQEVEDAYGRILAVGGRDAEMHATLTAQLDGSYAELRRLSALTWREPER